MYIGMYVVDNVVGGLCFKHYTPLAHMVVITHCKLHWRYFFLPATCTNTALALVQLVLVIACGGGMW